MPTATRAFPTDNLLVCAQCREKFSLTKGPEPRYTCHGPCGHSYRALELNRLTLPQITAAVITNVTFHQLASATASTTCTGKPPARRPTTSHRTKRYAGSPPTPTSS